jgi:uncharacterized membrane protein YagU involved in acid resistance
MTDTTSLTADSARISNGSIGTLKGSSVASQAILWGGLIAGILDSIDAVIAFGLKGMNPIQVLQYIASGVLGTAAFQGGLPTAALGAALHFFIAFVAAAVYYVASTKLPALAQQPVRYGLLYGVVVYFFMNYLVLPLSAVPKSPFSAALFLNGVIGHAILVGVTIALFTRRATQAHSL